MEACTANRRVEQVFREGGLPVEEVSAMLRSVLGGLEELRAQVGGIQHAMVRVEERLTGVEDGLAALRRDVTEEIHRLKRRDAK